MKNLFRDALPRSTRRCSGVRCGAGQGAAARPSRSCSVTDTVKAKAKPRPRRKSKAAAKDTTDLTLRPPLVAPVPGQLPGEYLVPEEQVPVAESLLARSDVQRLIPRGLEAQVGHGVLSRAGRSYRTLYAGEDRPIITGEYLQDAKATRDPHSTSRW